MKRIEKIDKRVVVILLIVVIAFGTVALNKSCAQRLNPQFETVRLDTAKINDYKIYNIGSSLYISQIGDSIALKIYTADNQVSFSNNFQYMVLDPSSDRFVFSTLSGTYYYENGIWRNGTDTTATQAFVRSIATSGTPAGSPGDIQANIAGVFGAAPMTTDGTNMTISGELNIGTQALTISDNSFNLEVSNVNTFGISTDLGDGDVTIYAKDATLEQTRIQLSSDIKSIIQSAVLGNGLRTYHYEDNYSFIDVGGNDTILKITPSGIKAFKTLTKNQHIGQLYIDASNTVATPVIATYYTVDDWTTDIAENVTLVDSSMTVTEDGYYRIETSMSYTHSSNSTIVHHSVFVDDVEQTEIESQRKIGNGGDVGNSGNTGILLLNAGEVVKLKMKADNTGTVTIEHANFNIQRL